MALEAWNNLVLAEKEQKSQIHWFCFTETFFPRPLVSAYQRLNDGLSLTPLRQTLRVVWAFLFYPFLRPTVLKRILFLKDHWSLTEIVLKNWWILALRKFGDWAYPLEVSHRYASLQAKLPCVCSNIFVHNIVPSIWNPIFCFPCFFSNICFCLLLHMYINWPTYCCHLLGTENSTFE